MKILRVALFAVLATIALTGVSEAHGHWGGRGRVVVVAPRYVYAGPGYRLGVGITAAPWLYNTVPVYGGPCYENGYVVACAPPIYIGPSRFYWGGGYWGGHPYGAGYYGRGWYGGGFRGHR
jgi:hypothetical protein